MGIDTPEEKNLQVNQMNDNYFATLDDDVENDEGVGQPPSPSGQSPSAQRRSGILQRLSPSEEYTLTAYKSDTGEEVQVVVHKDGSSSVAEPDPAVMPNTATMSREYHQHQ